MCERELRYQCGKCSFEGTYNVIPTVKRSLGAQWCSGGRRLPGVGVGQRWIEVVVRSPSVVTFLSKARDGCKLSWMRPKAKGGAAWKPKWQQAGHDVACMRGRIEIIPSVCISRHALSSPWCNEAVKQSSRTSQSIKPAQILELPTVDIGTSPSHWGGGRPQLI